MLQREADNGSVRYSSTIPLALIAVFLSLAAMSQPAHSQTYSVIYNFTDKGSDGASPYGGPILDQSGNLYGTTYDGGTYGSGNIYKLAPSGSSWIYSTLYSLKGIPDGSGPAFGTLAMRDDRVLFGTTEGGGDFGTAFAVCVSPASEIVVHKFGVGTDGAQPIGGVVLDPAGNFYGTTSLGGTYGNGTIFQEKRFGRGWTESVIYNFTGGNDGTNPPAGVTLDAHGNLFGTTSLGGIYGGGVVYKLSHSSSGWTQTVLYSFQGQSDGQNPVGGVSSTKQGICTAPLSMAGSTVAARCTNCHPPAEAGRSPCSTAS